ncbi:nitrilase-related carbon-nitrogen hydrolase [Leptothoe kymatousa]|uniref:Nitrilase n=1 Tax=Leptothoe kymatousa TAU-MAC 1615 TaxID=2364775 RepID=A0ABS5Y4Q9_9CYAN|nr:nitrilase-related carbon-nitrogen hydrolase [Leptothoe kymatousa]MBT9312812.1 nitrilase [Leptothoe kymatousa TAU-MAC 1615]
MTTTAFSALALQLKCNAVNRLGSAAEAREVMHGAIANLGPQVAAARAFIGADCRLVVLPEYWLTGFPMGESIGEWGAKACLAMDDPIYDTLATIAQKQGIFLAGNAYELDPNFPDLYFQNCFVLDPSGDMVLRYRRINSMYAPTPHDVWDKYLDIYGIDGVFPVAKTAIGNLAAVASDEILFPEVSRCLMLKGAEILLHPTSEVYGDVRKEAAKISRAVENMMYVVSANTAGIANTPILDASVDGGSKIIDYRGIVLAATGSGESMAAYGDIDLGALRRHRRGANIKNLLSRQRLDAYADIYKQFPIYPANSMAAGGVERSHFGATQKTVIERLEQLGVI